MYQDIIEKSFEVAFMAQIEKIMSHERAAQDAFQRMAESDAVDKRRRFNEQLEIAKKLRVDWDIDC